MKSLFTTVFLIFISFLHGQRIPQFDLQLSTDTSGNCTASLNGKFHGSIFIEQFRWNRWCRVDTLGLNQSWKDTTLKTVVHLHSGENQFRLMAIATNPYVNAVYSKVAKTTSSAKCKSYSQCNGEVLFGCNTDWEIVSDDGKTVTRGYGTAVKLTGLEKGYYWLYYDNSSIEFFGSQK